MVDFFPKKFCKRKIKFCNAYAIADADNDFYDITLMPRIPNGI